jgi:hypothetical protein
MGVFKKAFKPFAIMLATMIVFSSCQKDNENLPDKPELPSAETYEMDMSLFGESMPTNRLAGDTDGWEEAKGMLSGWVWLAQIYTAIPKAAFAAVKNGNEAVYDEEKGAWVWTTESQTAQGAFSVELQAVPSAENVNWEMWITMKGMEPFKWFEGETRLDGSRAEWQLNSYQNQGGSLNIVYEKDKEAGTASMTYTNAQSGYISFGTLAGGDFDAFYKIKGAAQENEVVIEWNRSTKAGRITLSEGVAYCWDNNQQPIACN